MAAADVFTMNWHEYFTYDPETGLLWWKLKTARIWSDGKFAPKAKVAGYAKKRPDGQPSCIDVMVNRKHYGAHRIIWEMHHGPIPTGMMIDHKDIDPWNNRLSNLRLATSIENGRNRGKTRKNTSGIKGVSYYKSGRSWQAVIKVNGKLKHLGQYPTKGTAACAYAKACLRYHGLFARIT